MTKNELTIKLTDWLCAYVKRNYSSNYDLQSILTPETTLSKINNTDIKGMTNYSAWEFTPDIIAILKDKNNGALSTLMVNRLTSSISLRDIGEAYVYSKLSKPLRYFVISTKGISNEVNILLVEDATRNRLLNVDKNCEIYLGSYNEKTNDIDDHSIIRGKGFCNSL